MTFKGYMNPLVLNIPNLVLMCIDCQLLQKQLQCDEGRHVYIMAIREIIAKSDSLPGFVHLVQLLQGNRY